jgi:general stress protein 26
MPDTKPDDASAIDKIWELADKLDPCLLVTRDGDWQRVRPVYARARRDEGRIYILTDTSGEKHEQIERFPQVSLAFADPQANDYVVINGIATVSIDREKIEDVWRFSDEAFWKAPDEPNLRLITVEPRDAELWDGSNVVVTGAKMIAERFLGAKVQLVENRKIDQI